MKKLTQMLGFENNDETEALLLQMIDEKDISASINEEDQTVWFHQRNVNENLKNKLDQYITKVTTANKRIQDADDQLSLSRKYQKEVARNNKSSNKRAEKSSFTY